MASYRKKSFVNKKVKGLNLKVTEEEYEMIDKEARKRGISISALIYPFIFNALKRLK